MHKQRIIAILVLCLAVALAGCARANPLDNTSWALAELSGRPPLADTTVTLSIADGQLSGRDGCNLYSAPVRVRGSRLEITGPLISTLMACEQTTMEQADAYRTALEGVASFRLDQGRLTLLGADGAVLALLEAAGQ